MFPELPPEEHEELVKAIVDAQYHTAVIRLIFFCVVIFIVFVALAVLLWN